MNAEQAAALRHPFPPEAIGKLPRVTCRACSKAPGKVCDKHSKVSCEVCRNWITTAHIHLDFVGHAGVTDRLLVVDPEWSWEPVAFDEGGAPLIRMVGSEASMWIRLTVAGVTRLGVGTANSDVFELPKQLISDALRNAAMRFGVALDLWSKEDLQAVSGAPPLPEEGAASPATRNNGGGDATPEVSANQLARARARAQALTLEKVSVASARKAAKLPTLTEDIAPGTFGRWLELLDRLEADLEESKAPFREAGAL